MNGVNELYRMFKDGLEMTPGPEDHSFTDVWELYSDVTSMAGVRLMEPRLGSSVEGAEEVRRISLASNEWQKSVKVCQ